MRGLTIGTTNGPAAGVGGELLISPNGVAHFAGCLHKGGDPDYSSWASLSLPRAWERLGNGDAPRCGQILEEASKLFESVGVDLVDGLRRFQIDVTNGHVKPFGRPVG